MVGSKGELDDELPVLSGLMMLEFGSVPIFY